MSGSRPRLRARLAGVLLVGMLALAACSPLPSTPEADTALADAELMIAETAEVTSLNPASAVGASAVDQRLSSLTHETFAFLDDDLEVTPNDRFGTMTQIADDPLTIEYRVSDDARWSDGTSITTDDLLLGWAVASGYFDDAELDDDGSVVSGTRYFDTAAARAGASRTAARDTLRPEVSDDDRVLTLVYADPTADWNRIWLLDKPIHVVAAGAGMEVDDLVTAILETPAGDPDLPRDPQPTLLAAAEFWNTGFGLERLADDPSIAVGNGPYVVDAWRPGSALFLRANDAYTGAHGPRIDSVVLRFDVPPEDAARDLRNGEVDVIRVPEEPGARDELAALTGIRIADATDPAPLQLMLAFTGPFLDVEIRRAFLDTVPRDDLVAARVEPLDAGGSVRDSFVFAPAQTAAYTSAVARNGSVDYAETDIPAAAAALGDRRPEVRLGYDRTDPEQVASFRAIRTSAQSAGFVVADAGVEGLPAAGSYDAVLTDRSLAAGPSAGWGDVLAAVGGADASALSEPEVAELVTELDEATDPADARVLLADLDAALFASAAGLPLYSVPEAVAFSDVPRGLRLGDAVSVDSWDVAAWERADDD